MKKILFTTTMVAAASVANATLIFEETFNYTQGTDTFITEGSWTGISTASYGNIQDETSTRFSTAGLNPLGNTASNAAIFSGDEIEKAVTGGTGQNQTYYFSYMFDTAAATTSQLALQVNFSREFIIGTNGSLDFGIGVTSGTFGSIDGTSATLDTTTLSASTEYFVVGVVRIDDAGPNDAYTLGASIFTSGDAAAAWAGTVNTGTITGADWDHFHGGVNWPDIGGMSDTITAVRINSSGSGTFYDEIRIGTALGDVVPEPSSYALISGALALGWIMLRRRK